MGSLDALLSATDSDESDNAKWRTPPEVFAPLRREFRIGLDACAVAESALVPWWIGPDHPNPTRRDALTADWRACVGSTSASAFSNPPYGRDVGRFVGAASKWGEVMPVVLLIFARTETLWWHEIIMAKATEVRFIKGRVSFLRHDGTDAGPATAPSAVVVFEPRQGLLRLPPRFSSWAP